MKKLTILVSGAIGYVLGTRAGRERYEQIKGMAGKVKDDPRVQEKAQQAADVARAQAPVVKDRISEAAESAKSKVSGSHAADDLPDESLVNQDDPYPKGDLP
ncbi:hypothetical protein [Nocardioides coralli]|uniref:hypothetical protein n=1 Tax=Nocardioides coralli TaxID=2872154 RepID=UPI001CA44B3A|nr:hypothetical protein [Nocardioides coralli]QZY30295.1 hypothetical protein K6T13_06415 [Nocardioides coralli]